MMYGMPAKCPRCRSPFILKVGFESEEGRPVPLLQYPEGGAIGLAERGQN